jgi:hypothetical protein
MRGLDMTIQDYDPDRRLASGRMTHPHAANRATPAVRSALLAKSDRQHDRGAEAQHRGQRGRDDRGMISKHESGDHVDNAAHREAEHE